MVDFAIIILNYNTKNLLKKCLTSILDKKWRHKIEVWVVDNASKDESVDMAKKEFPTVKLIVSKKNLGFSGGNNLALQKAQAKYYLLLNSDTEITDASLDVLIDAMEKNHFDIASCKLINPDGTLQANAGNLPFDLPLLVWLFGLDNIPFFKDRLASFHQKSQKYYTYEREVGWVSGSVFVLRKEVLQRIGLLDDTIFMYGEDVDYCIRAKREGFKIGWVDKAIIMHIGGGSSKNPHLRQWAGEFKGLLYLYKKYFGSFSASMLKYLMYIAIVLRMLAFFVICKPDYAKTYARILREGL